VKLQVDDDSLARWDVCLDSSGAVDWRDIISASSGTQSVVQSGSCIDSYIGNAAVPRDSWRALTAEELDQLTIPPNVSCLKIGLIQINPEVWEAFHELREVLATAASHDAARIIVASDQWQHLITAALRSVTPWVMDDLRTFAGVGLCVNPPGLPTVTFDEARKGYIGLHVDNWYDDLSPDKAPGRICINLGSSARYFLFSPLSLTGMELAMAPDGRNLDRRGDLARAFFRRFPDQPVLRLRVTPGEAYIAPTENISHDGSTLDQAGWDLTLTVRGWFAVKKQAGRMQH
jgi:hypothetical protein